MIFTIIKGVSKISTVFFIAKTGLNIYQKGAIAYKSYKKVNAIKDAATANKGVQKITSLIKVMKNKK